MNIQYVIEEVIEGGGFFLQRNKLLKWTTYLNDRALI